MNGEKKYQELWSALPNTDHLCSKTSPPFCQNSFIQHNTTHKDVSSSTKIMSCLHEESSDESNLCPICRDSLAGELDIGVCLPCGHVLHTECFDGWKTHSTRGGSNSPKCPMCNVVGTNFCKIYFNLAADDSGAGDDDGIDELSYNDDNGSDEEDGIDGAETVNGRDVIVIDVEDDAEDGKPTDPVLKKLRLYKRATLRHQKDVEKAQSRVNEQTIQLLKLSKDKRTLETQNAEKSAKRQKLQIQVDKEQENFDTLETEVKRLKSRSRDMDQQLHAISVKHKDKMKYLGRQLAQAEERTKHAYDQSAPEIRDLKDYKIPKLIKENAELRNLMTKREHRSQSTPSTAVARDNPPRPAPAFARGSSKRSKREMIQSLGAIANSKPVMTVPFIGTNSATSEMGKVSHQSSSFVPPRAPKKARVVPIMEQSSSFVPPGAPQKAQTMKQPSSFVPPQPRAPKKARVVPIMNPYVTPKPQAAPLPTSHMQSTERGIDNILDVSERAATRGPGTQNSLPINRSAFRNSFSAKPQLFIGRGRSGRNLRK